MKTDFRSIIVRVPNWIGDVVMATPVLEDLRTSFPQAELTVMCLSSVAPLLEHDPAIDKLFHFSPIKGFFRRISARNVVEELRRGHYDLGLLLTTSFSSAWYFWQGHVHNRVGFKHEGRGILLNRKVPFPSNRERQHRVLTYKTLLQLLGVPISTTHPRLILTKEEIQNAWRFVGRFNVTQEQKIIGINPSASTTSKRYLSNRFREIAQRLVETDSSFVVLFFGAASHKDLVNEICKELPSRVLNLAGQTNLRELMSLIKICSLFLSNDSGPMHIADSLGIPLLALFGATDPAVTGPYRQNREVIQKETGCAPCWKEECVIDSLCMKRISTDEVVEILLKKMAKLV